MLEQDTMLHEIRSDASVNSQEIEDCAEFLVNQESDSGTRVVE